MNKIHIFTDGSSRGNPGPGGWGAIIVSDTEVIELGGYASRTTNNRMEINAALSALEEIVRLKIGQSGVADAPVAITIFTDSSYLINSITKWVHGWKEKGWITSQKEEVQNRDLWEAMLVVTSRLSSASCKIDWKYVGGHIGIVGNERCDEIATTFADGTPAKLYRGPLDQYKISDILDISASETNVKKTTKDKSRSKAKAYSYISALDGKVLTHATWAQCEARVKGKRGARFKKALSAGEERAIMAEFGAK